MAQITTLKDKDGKTLYPITTTKAVLNENGIDVDTLLSGKVDEERGKGLSSNDYTSDDKSKLANLPTSDGLEKLLNAKQSALKDSEDITITDNELSVTEKAKRQLFVDMWNEAWTIYGRLDYDSSITGAKHIMGKYAPKEAPDPTKPFKAYDLWLTYEEAVQVMDEYKWSKGQTNLKSYLTAGRAKVAVPIAFGVSENIDLTDLLCYNNTIEEICFYIGIDYLYGYGISSLSRAFHGSKNVIRKIHGVIVVTKTCKYSSCFHTPKLESFHLHGLAATLDLKYCPLLTLDTFQYLIKNRADTSAITITVHPNVYAKFIGDTANDAYNDLTDEEKQQWTTLMAKAAEKNISIVTTE